MHAFMERVGRPDYVRGWRWSVGDVGEFWGTIDGAFGLLWQDTPTSVLTGRAMPEAELFAAGTLS